MTFRHNLSQTALPIRSWGAFMPPNGVGGGGVHWNAETWRFLPSDFQMKTRVIERYGGKFLPSDMTIQDWGVSWPDQGGRQSLRGFPLTRVAGWLSSNCHTRTIRRTRSTYKARE